MESRLKTCPREEAWLRAGKEEKQGFPVSSGKRKSCVKGLAV